MSSMKPMDPIWYNDGLRFRCTRCGNCCTGADGYIWVTEEEIARIAAERGEPLEEFRRLFVRRVGTRLSLREKANGHCVMYDPDRGCTVYPVRPAQCRTWPFWESNVATPDDWKRTCAECPGAGQGDLIPVDEIRRRIAAIPL